MILNNYIVEGILSIQSISNSNQIHLQEDQT